MADLKLTQLPLTTVAADGDYLYIVKNVAGIQTSYAILKSNFGAVANDSITLAKLAADLKAEVALGAGTDIDWALGLTFTKTLASAWTMTFSNPVVGKTIMIVTTGDFVITFPTGVDVTEIVNYDGTKRNVMVITCVSTALPLYSLTDRAYTI